MSKLALIIVDVQKDFLPGGALGVAGGDEVIGPLIEAGNMADVVAFTRDYHPADHISFSDQPEFVDKSWPPHCVAGTEGASIHPALLDAFPDAPIFSKGQDPNVEQYSGFEGVRADGLSLSEWLEQQDVTVVLVGGLATDYCVASTAQDVVGYYPGDTIVLADCIRAVSQTTGAVACADMADDGIVVVTTEQAASLTI